METFRKDDKYYRAKERLTLIKKFYMSLTFFIIFAIFIASLNYYVDQWRHPWFLWAVGGWGLGLFFQGAKAFKWNPIMGKNWEARKMKEFMEENDNEPTVKF
ncbi:histidine kinase [Patiriisocius marinistellae]|uniref:Histidine kinase n=1 Tax=Patiriisocius marinistellae TaxID=2494560 RepID=A0A5J4G0B3_9FLAO|nr:2TM domain-containing protein [Patiriisocius marinistellae]GEQ85906.1 histidine kinase [Patiriisocius marinistellae]